MRVSSLSVDNFKAIKRVELSSLPDAIVVAGPNGCGKSSVFDALRLLKSAYGGYQQHEWHQWFSEFQINIQKLSTEASRVLHDPQKPLRIEAQVELAQSEIEYLTKDSYRVVEKLNWREALGRKWIGDGDDLIIDPTARSTHGAKVEKNTKLMIAGLEKELSVGSFPARLEMSSDGAIDIEPSMVLGLSLVFMRRINWASSTIMAPIATMVGRMSAA